MAAARLRVTAVRLAEPTDLPLLAGVEAAADAMFAPLVDVTRWLAPAHGAARAAERGWLLVVGQPVVGFAHVLDLGEHAHLEQLAVHPDHQRRGVGEMLLRAAYGVALDAGYRTLSLMTYAAVPWNAPWYARHGFVRCDPHEDRDVWEALAPMRAAEEALGLAAGGERVTMVRPLADRPAPVEAASVIPVREGAGGLEVFVQHRAATMDFAPGAVVFPGGRREPRDATLLDTAVRELVEETGAVAAVEALVPWDRWVTPVGSPRRFDVHFLLWPVEAGAEVGHTTSEATHAGWERVGDLVAGAETGRLVMVPPQRVIVDELAALGSLDAVLALRPAVEAVTHDLLRTPRPRRSP